MRDLGCDHRVCRGAGACGLVIRTFGWSRREGHAEAVHVGVADAALRKVDAAQQEQPIGVSSKLARGFVCRLEPCLGERTESGGKELGLNDAADADDE